MTMQDRIVKSKMGLLELAEYLKNVSEACKIHRVSHQHFYDIKKVYEEHGMDGLKDKSRRKPCLYISLGPSCNPPIDHVYFGYRKL